MPLQETTKKCSGCRQTKMIDDFFISGQDTEKKYGAVCEECSTNFKANIKQNQRKYAQKYAPKYRRSLREQVLIAYGEKCACCGETEPKFLALDHINNDGAKHRREIGMSGGSPFYAWTIKNRFPSTLQLLCHNCNMAKAFYGQCPHSL